MIRFLQSTDLRTHGLLNNQKSKTNGLVMDYIKKIYITITYIIQKIHQSWNRLRCQSIKTQKNSSPWTPNLINNSVGYPRKSTSPWPLRENKRKKEAKKEKEEARTAGRFSQLPPPLGIERSPPHLLSVWLRHSFRFGL
jgi:hypothetical protein